MNVKKKMKTTKLLVMIKIANHAFLKKKELVFIVKMDILKEKENVMN